MRLLALSPEINIYFGVLIVKNIKFHKNASDINCIIFDFASIV